MGERLRVGRGYKYRDIEPDSKTEGEIERENDLLSTIHATFNPLIHGLFSDPYLKVLLEGVRLMFFIFFLHRGIRNKKVLQGQEFSDLGCLSIF